MVKTAQASVRLTNKRGLHARASAKFVQCVEAYDAEVEVTSHNNMCAETVFADSIMELLMLGAGYGEDLSLRAQGVQAEEVIEALKQLIDNNFGEDV